MSYIKINNIAFSYDSISGNHINQVIRDISVEISKNECIGIVGKNGVGKSTLLKLLVGIEMVNTGGISINNIELGKSSLREIRQRVGYVFQDSDSQLFMPTVFEDVAFGPTNYGLTKIEIEKRTNSALQNVHIEHLAEKKVYQLSGGEKKLASIATVLALQPEVILLDEPSVALDPQNRRNLIHVLNQITTTKIVASHDLDFIYDTCKRTILMNHGGIVADGDTKVILKDRVLLEQNGLELPLSFSRSS